MPPCLRRYLQWWHLSSFKDTLKANLSPTCCDQGLSFTCLSSVQGILLKAHTQLGIWGTMGGIRSFSTPYINIVIFQEQGSLAGEGTGITVLFWLSAGRCLIEVESQEEGKDWWRMEYDGEWWGFPHSLCQQQCLLSLTVLQTLLHAVTPFSPCCAFPPARLPCLPMYLAYDSMHKQVVRERATGGHLAHGVARISYQSQCSQSSFSQAAWGYRAKLVDWDWQL